jgi:hypothetical protein
MVNEKLIAFILKARTNKRQDDKIKEQLVSVGWKQEAIDEAFAEIKKGQGNNTMPAEKPSQVEAPAKPVENAPPWVKPEVLQEQKKPDIQQQTEAFASPIVKKEPMAFEPKPETPPAFHSVQASGQPSRPPPAIVPPSLQAQAPAPQNPIPPAKEINLPQEKKSLFSFLSGKKPQPPLQAQSTASPIDLAQAQTAQPQAAELQSAKAVASAQPPAAQIAAGSAWQPPAASSPPVQPGAAEAQPQALSPTPPIKLPPEKKSNIMPILLAIAIILIIAIAAGAYYALVMLPSQNAEPILPSQPVSPPVQNATPQNQPLQAAEPIRCGQDDYDCLAQASEECKPAVMPSNTTTELLGLLINSKGTLKISPSGINKCSLYTEIENTSVRFSDLLVTMMISQGTPLSEIKQQEQNASAQAGKASGLNGTCIFSNSELKALLIKWKTSFSSKDYDNAKCSGKLFESLNSGIAAQLTPPQQNTTAPANATIPKANSTVANATYNATKPNTTIALPQPANTTQTALAKNTSLDLENVFKYSIKYTTYFPERLAWFCVDRGMEFYRMHYQDYFGGGCDVVKPKSGYVNYTEYMSTGCTILPCCLDGPYNEYSRSYDYFECGYNASVS